jgi:hypothetical protein
MYSTYVIVGTVSNRHTYEYWESYGMGVAFIELYVRVHQNLRKNDRRETQKIASRICVACPTNEQTEDNNNNKHNDHHGTPEAVSSGG